MLDLRNHDSQPPAPGDFVVSGSEAGHSSSFKLLGRTTTFRNSLQRSPASKSVVANPLTNQ